MLCRCGRNLYVRADFTMTFLTQADFRDGSGHNLLYVDLLGMTRPALRRSPLRLLSPRLDRAAKPRTEAEPKRFGQPAPERHDDDLAERQLAATQAIGARYEGITSAVDAASQLIGRLGELQTILADVREPIAQEFAAHKGGHAELLALRHSAARSEERFAEVQAVETDLRRRLEEAERALADANGRAESSSLQLETLAIEADQLRRSLAQAETLSGEQAAKLAHLQALTAEREADIGALRHDLAQHEEHRREIDGQLARARHQSLLDAEELQALRGRAERSNAETNRLSRAESDLAAQLSLERSRVVAAEALMSQANAEAVKLTEALEQQLSATRWELEAAQTRADTLAAQASKLNEMVTDQSSRLEAANAAGRAAERRVAEFQGLLARADERLRAFEDEMSIKRQALGEVEIARAAAVERAQQLARKLQTLDGTVRRGDDRNGVLRATVEQLQAAEVELRRTHAEQLKEIQSALERKQTDSAIVEGALESARRDRARLQVALLGNGEKVNFEPAG